MQTKPGVPAPVLFNRRTPPHILTLVLASGLAAVAMNVFLPSLPGLAAHFNTDYGVAQLAVSGYLAATAALQLIIGPMSDRYGRRPVMLAAMGLFIAATIGCLLAPTIEVFLFFRFMQAGVAASFAISRTIARDVTEGAAAASMVGYVTMGMAIAPMLGPAIGGALDELYGWRAPFLGLLAMGVGVTWLIWADLGETNTARSTSFSAQFRNYPALVASRRFWGYAMAAAFASGSFFAFLGGAPFVSLVVLGLSPSETGAWFAAIALGYAVGNGISGRYAARIGVNGMMLAGTMTATSGMGLSLILFALLPPHPALLYGPALFVGLGNGFTMPSATVGAMSVRPHLAGSAAGLGATLMIGGGAALSAFTGAILSEETGVWPLILVMFASSAASVCAALFVLWVEKRRGPLAGVV